VQKVIKFTVSEYTPDSIVILASDQAKLKEISPEKKPTSCWLFLFSLPVISLKLDSDFF